MDDGLSVYGWLENDTDYGPVTVLVAMVIRSTPLFSKFFFLFFSHVS